MARKRKGPDRGQHLIFHGAYGSKRRAKEAEKKGEFIFERPIRGHERFILASDRKR
jgi:hypothetical protein